jgi:hypothetical protein
MRFCLCCAQTHSSEKEGGDHDSELHGAFELASFFDMRSILE